LTEGGNILLLPYPWMSHIYSQNVSMILPKHKIITKTNDNRYHRVRRSGKKLSHDAR
jgi:hypothetical protein